MSSYADRACLAMNDLNARETFSFELRARGFRIFFGGKRQNFGPPSARLFQRGLNISAGGNGEQLKSFRIGFDYAEGAAANGACRAEDGNALHLRTRTTELIRHST